jgi:PAS domain S-box-containing protein
MTKMDEVKVQRLNDIDYRLLIEHIPAITYIAAWDEDSSTIYTSPQIERLLGFSQTTWMADPTRWLKQIHPDDRQRVLEELTRIRAGGEPDPVEYRMLTFTGEVRWFRDDTAVLRDDDGRPLALYGVMLDITRETELEAALVEVQHYLWEARRPTLCERELKVLRLIRDRYTDSEIARKLTISERTVRNDVKAICAKLGVRKRAESVREAILWKLIDE